MNNNISARPWSMLSQFAPASNASATPPVLTTTLAAAAADHQMTPRRDNNAAASSHPHRRSWDAARFTPEPAPPPAAKAQAINIGASNPIARFDEGRARGDTLSSSAPSRTLARTLSWDGRLSPRTPPPPEVMVSADHKVWVRLPPMLDYEAMLPIVLTEAQVGDVPNFDFQLEERTLAQLERPVAILNGNVAHVFAYADLAQWWRANRSNPFTRLSLSEGDMRRVVNLVPEEQRSVSPKRLQRRNRFGI